mgnify:CR=1 FL=1
MRRTNPLRVATILVATVVVALWGLTGAGQAPTRTVTVDADDIGGVVTGTKGPEAGVWVIAETTDLPTRLIKSVVTDDQGRYLVPDLPKASYNVWVRGYGLVDSPKVKAAPGQQLSLTAVAAPDARSSSSARATCWRSSSWPACHAGCLLLPEKAATRLRAEALRASPHPRAE